MLDTAESDFGIIPMLLPVTNGTIPFSVLNSWPLARVTDIFIDNVNFNLLLNSYSFPSVRVETGYNATNLLFDEFNMRGQDD